MTFDNNYKKPIPVDQHKQNELMSSATVRAMDLLVDKLGDIYIRGKELENKSQEIETIQLEIVEYYKTQRTGLLEAFNAKKDMRIGLEKLLERAFNEDNHELKIAVLDLYKEYISSLNFDTSINQFKRNDRFGSQGKTIEI